MLTQEDCICSLACAGLRVKRSGFQSMCCVLVQNTLLLQCVSTQEYKWVALINLIKCEGDNGGMDLHPVQGWVVILPVASCEETRIK